MKIGIAFDLAPAAASQARDGPDDQFEEFDKPETIETLAAVLRGEGHDVVLLGDGRPFIEAVLADPPDLVWNMAEGVGVGRCRESRVPAFLEMLGIPCTGSDALTLAASLDKDVAKRLVKSSGVDVPRSLWIDPVDHGNLALDLEIFASKCPPPWIVKPAYEGSSKGIRSASLIDDVHQAASLVVSLIGDYAQPLLVEEFIDGDEVTVGIIGEGPEAKILGAMKILPRRLDERFVYSLEMKREWRERVVYEVPARLSNRSWDLLTVGALVAYMALGCRDVARLDFRFRGDVPYFLEANPLPGLSSEWSDLVILARGVGIDYPSLIRKILDATMKRIKAS